MSKATYKKRLDKIDNGKEKDESSNYTELIAMLVTESVISAETLEKIRSQNIEQDFGAILECCTDKEVLMLEYLFYTPEEREKEKEEWHSCTWKEPRHLNIDEMEMLDKIIEKYQFQ